MTNYHCAMTIQSNSAPSDVLTRTAVLPGHDAQQLHDLMYVTAVEAWRVEHPGTTMGDPVVVHWSFSPVETSSTPGTLATPACEPGAPVSQEALGAWLVENGYAEKRRGYGHVDGDTLAEALLGRFSITALD